RYNAAHPSSTLAFPIRLTRSGNKSPVSGSRPRFAAAEQANPFLLIGRPNAAAAGAWCCSEIDEWRSGVMRPGSRPDRNICWALCRAFLKSGEGAETAVARLLSGRVTHATLSAALSLQGLANRPIYSAALD